jgi:hypothetical protein
VHRGRLVIFGGKTLEMDVLGDAFELSIGQFLAPSMVVRFC